MRISDWSSDVCSSDLRSFFRSSEAERRGASWRPSGCHCPVADCDRSRSALVDGGDGGDVRSCPQPYFLARRARLDAGGLSPLLSLETAFRRRSEEHTSELQSLMRNSYAVFCLKKKTKEDTPRRENDTNSQHANSTKQQK